MVHDPTDFEMVKLEEDAILCDFNPWFRGLDWTSYRRFAPKSIPMNICQVIEQNKFTFQLDLARLLLDWLFKRQVQGEILRLHSRSNAARHSSIFNLVDGFAGHVTENIGLEFGCRSKVEKIRIFFMGGDLFVGVF